MGGLSFSDLEQNPADTDQNILRRRYVCVGGEGGREGGRACHSTLWNLLSHFLPGNTLKKKKRFKQQSKEQGIKKKNSGQ